MEPKPPPELERSADGRWVPPRVFADDVHERQFWDEGYVRVPLLDADGLVALEEGYRDLRPSDGFDPRTRPEHRSEYHCTFLDPDRDYRRASDELVRRVFGPELERIVPGYRILTSNTYVKPPGTGRFEIHQNWPTLEHLDVPTVTAWIPLQDTGFENGTLRLAVGSHHLFPDVAAASSERFFDDFEAGLIEKYLRPMELAAGEALIFDDSLLHWSSDNLSDSPRVSFQIEMVPVDVRTVLWVRNPDDPGRFDMWASSTEFYLEADISEVISGPHGLEHVGSVPNPNRRISFEEFEDTMRRRDEIRRAKYALG
jgi:hypothetical protein